MRAGVIDVGSNTVRLLVARMRDGRLEPVFGERTYLGLATDIERTGAISAKRLSGARELASRYARLAADHGAARVEVIVTAPGRQAGNADELRAALAETSGGPVRQLSAEEEGRLAYAGAVGACRSVPETVAVIDVGGGSTQLMVGRPDSPVWLRCLDLGSLRLTERLIGDDPPSRGELETLERAVTAAFEGVTPPLPIGVLATGGTARTLRRIAGRRLGEKSLTAALSRFVSRPSRDIAVELGVLPERARVLPAGTIVLREAHRLLGVKLEVAKGGVREGAVRAVLDELTVEAA